MNTLAIIHIAKKQLGLDDDTYRDALERETGKRSAADLSEPERLKVIAAFKKRGFKGVSNTRKDGRKKLTGKYAKKLQALWIAAWNLGIVENKDDAALITFVKRQTGVDHVRWLHDAEDAFKAIEALKAWMTREANVNWSGIVYDPPYARADGFKIAWAQWLKLRGDVHGHSAYQFWQFVSDTAEGEYNATWGPNSFQWIDVMNALGKKIRAQG